jgi:hypothetical protein
MWKIALILLLSSYQTFACVPRNSSASYLHQKEILCHPLWIDIMEPSVMIRGQSHRLGISKGDLEGGCPSSDPKCYPPFLNLKKRLDSICRSYGFKSYLQARTYSFNFGITQVAVLKNNSQGKLAPALENYDYSFMTMKSISCLE